MSRCGGYTHRSEQVRPRDQERGPDLGDGGGQRAGAGPGEDIPADAASDGRGTQAGQAQCGHVAGQVTVEARQRILALLPSAAGSAALPGAGTRRWR